MREVAILANVSLATVSRVVNGSAVVHQDLADRVHDAIAMLDYRPDEGARTLRRADRASRSIGLIFDDVSNPFFAAIHRGVEDFATQRGVLTFVGSSDNDLEVERRLVDSFAGRGVDGLVIAPTAGDHSYLEHERAGGVGVVFVDRPPDGIAADLVMSDNVQAGRTSTVHLLAHGHEDIAFLGDHSSRYTARERLRGYEHALHEHGVAIRHDRVRTGLTDSTTAEQTVRELLTADVPPTAIVSAQNLITIGAVTALRGLGLRKAVALVGIDDLPLSDVIEPGLTVLAQDAYELGAKAADLLFDTTGRAQAGAARRVVLPTRLIIRGSGEIAPTN
jgi:LacI family transcriptional regulator